jgi:transposase InsO family protein
VITYDFMQDSTVDGRKLRCLTIVDEFTRECLAIRVARSFRSADVIRVLAPVFAEYGPPAFIRSDNGSEFIAWALCAWLYRQGIDTHHIDPASPWQNAYGESFNARFRDECLSREEFLTVVEAQAIVDAQRGGANTMPADRIAASTILHQPSSCDAGRLSRISPGALPRTPDAKRSALGIAGWTNPTKGQALKACPACNGRAALRSVSTVAVPSALARRSLSRLLDSLEFIVLAVARGIQQAVR